MSCNNCYNGCGDIVSDACVKYTGPPIPSLGINTNDTLYSIESTLITFLLTALNGTGINLAIEESILCDKIKTYLPESGDISLIDITSALIQTVCDIQIQVDANTADLVTLNADYTLECLTGVTTDAGTHDILQAVITKLCSVNTTLTALTLSLPVTYVKLSDLNTLIANYLASVSSSTLMKNRMVPYSVIPFFDADLSSKFDLTGKGLAGTDWQDIYLCNGENGTPDLRGRGLVGVTDGTMGGGVMNAAVIPNAYNPTYTLNSIQGNNSVQLSSSHMPLHTHTATSTVTDSHFHYQFNSDVTIGDNPWITTNTYPVYRGEKNDNSSYRIMGSATVATLGKTATASSPITVNTTNSNAGGNTPHTNIQPVTGCYFIQYRP